MQLITKRQIIVDFLKKKKDRNRFINYFTQIVKMY